MTYDGRGLKFGTVAEQYDRYRPGTPEAFAPIIGDIEGLRILELGAGTGKLTGFLVAHGAKVSVIEPDKDMLAVLLRNYPSVEALSGSAESVEAEDATFDAVWSSSAWHWFTQPETIVEVARVLKDNGTLGVIWNGFSRSDPFVEALTQLREPKGGSEVRPRGWNVDVKEYEDFVGANDVHLDWMWQRTIDEVVALFGTYSSFFIQSDETKDDLYGKLRALLNDHVGDENAPGDSTVAIPMVLRGTIARRQARS